MRACSLELPTARSGAEAACWFVCSFSPLLVAFAASKSTPAKVAPRSRGAPLHVLFPSGGCGCFAGDERWRDGRIGCLGDEFGGALCRDGAAAGSMARTVLAASLLRVCSAGVSGTREAGSDAGESGPFAGEGWESKSGDCFAGVSGTHEPVSDAGESGPFAGEASGWESRGGALSRKA